MPNYYFVNLIIPFSILKGEIVSGPDMGLPTGVVVRGIGLYPMKKLRPPEELTEFCQETDVEYAAEVIENGDL